MLYKGDNFWDFLFAFLCPRSLLKKGLPLTLDLLNPDMPCLCKQCRSKSVGFPPTDLDLHCLPFSIWICINNVDKVIWLAEYYKWAWHLFSMARIKGKHLVPNTVFNLVNFQVETDEVLEIIVKQQSPVVQSFVCLSLIRYPPCL